MATLINAAVLCSVMLVYEVRSACIDQHAHVGGGAMRYTEVDDADTIIHSQRDTGSVYCLHDEQVDGGCSEWNCGSTALMLLKCLIADLLILSDQSLVTLEAST